MPSSVLKELCTVVFIPGRIIDSTLRNLWQVKDSVIHQMVKEKSVWSAQYMIKSALIKV